MSKVRIYNVTMKNIHGDLGSEKVAAHSKETAESYFAQPHVSATAEFIGFFEVELLYSGSDITFRVADKDFQPESPSYNWLCEYMTVDINKFIDLLRRNGEYP